MVVVYKSLMVPLTAARKVGKGAKQLFERIRGSDSSQDRRDQDLREKTSLL